MLTNKFPPGYLTKRINNSYIQLMSDNTINNSDSAATNNHSSKNSDNGIRENSTPNPTLTSPQNGSALQNESLASSGQEPPTTNNPLLNYYFIVVPEAVNPRNIQDWPQGVQLQIMVPYLIRTREPTQEGREEDSFQSPPVSHTFFLEPGFFVSNSPPTVFDQQVMDIMYQNYLNETTGTLAQEKSHATNASFLESLPVYTIDKNCPFQREFGDCVIECPICIEEGEQGETWTVLPCDHKFHMKCLQPWLQENHSCPSCRYQLPTKEESIETVNFHAIMEETSDKALSISDVTRWISKLVLDVYNNYNTYQTLNRNKGAASMELDKLDSLLTAELNELKWIEHWCENNGKYPPSNAAKGEEEMKSNDSIFDSNRISSLANQMVKRVQYLQSLVVQMHEQFIPQASGA